MALFRFAVAYVRASVIPVAFVAALFRIRVWVSDLETFGLYPPPRLMEELVHCNRGR